VGSTGGAAPLPLPLLLPAAAAADADAAATRFTLAAGGAGAGVGGGGGGGAASLPPGIGPVTLVSGGTPPSMYMLSPLLALALLQAPSLAAQPASSSTLAADSGAALAWPSRLLRRMRARAAKSAASAARASSAVSALPSRTSAPCTASMAPE
jgi:hypothetical protein